MNTVYFVPARSELAKTRKYIQDMKDRKIAFLAKMSLRLVSEDIARLMESAAQEGVGEVFVSKKNLSKQRGSILRRIPTWAEEDPATWEGYAEILELDRDNEALDWALFEHVYSPESDTFDRVMRELCPVYLEAGYSVSRESTGKGYYISGW